MERIFGRRTLQYVDGELYFPLFLQWLLHTHQILATVLREETAYGEAIYGGPSCCSSLYQLNIKHFAEIMKPQHHHSILLQSNL